MKVTLLLVLGLVAASLAQETQSAKNLRRVVRRRGRQRQRTERQLFGNRVVLPAAPLPLAAQPLAPAPIPIAHAAATPFIGAAPQPVQLVQVRQPQLVRVNNAYASPAPAPAPEPVAPVAPVEQPSPVIDVRTQPAVPLLHPAPITVAATRAVPVSLAKPVAITASVYNAPGTNLASPHTYNYAFEAENGIKQSAVGEMRLVGDSEVVVMRGSYEYIGADGLVYVVNWVADENGYRAEAPHLPQPVEIPFPEQREAVAAQVRFAQEQVAAASNAGPTFAALPEYAY